ncbi:class I SAM-dependent methyltransferase [Mucilaginibacter calamicampi]|uniref:Class I SAM-dependent methyltransferase n=1 Tax=Mucilaginibacter calamicampi TaxID=1302352 RepID=A0ABW2YV27_9SPHI
MDRYVQYGCGFSAPQGWINYDASPTLRFERIPLIGKFYTKNSQPFPSDVRYGDIVKGLPEAPNSSKGVYCSHILEHLCYEDFILALKNTYKILQPGGVFRGVVPDLRSAAEDYLASFGETANPAAGFMRGTLLGVERRERTLQGLLKGMMGNSKHLWMWDYPSLEAELHQAGFRNIRQANYGDAEDQQFKLVEDEGRFYKAAAFECFK